MSCAVTVLVFGVICALICKPCCPIVRDAKARLLPGHRRKMTCLLCFSVRRADPACKRGALQVEWTKSF